MLSIVELDPFRIIQWVLWWTSIICMELFELFFPVQTIIFINMKIIICILLVYSIIKNTTTL